MEIFVKQDQVTPVWIGLELFEIPETGRRPFSSCRNMLVMRRDNSPATSHRVIIFPDPVGNSTLKSSPR